MIEQIDRFLTIIMLMILIGSAIMCFTLRSSVPDIFYGVLAGIDVTVMCVTLAWKLAMAGGETNGRGTDNDKVQ